uniref:t-SNARE coiled-coil homology domain-containing protein n=1 Tax=Strongyloides stercoralis TaxID=6248 RepID=A0A0K0ECD7_STRER
MIKNRLKELQENSISNELSLLMPDIAKSSKSLIENNKNDELNNFFTSLKTIRNYMQRMEEILEIVAMKQSEILVKPGLTDYSNTILNTLNEEFKDLTKVCINQIKAWNKEIKNSTINNLTVIERIKQNHVISLNLKIEKLLCKYNDYEMTYRDKIIKKIKIYYKSLNNIVSETEIEKLIMSNDIHKLSKSIILGGYNKDEILDDIKSRNENINKLEKNIRELHEMYCDLMMLTELQNGKINYITNEIEEAFDQIEKGKESIEKSKKNKLRGIKVSIL